MYNLNKKNFLTQFEGKYIYLTKFFINITNVNIIEHLVNFFVLLFVIILLGTYYVSCPPNFVLIIRLYRKQNILEN